MSDGYSPLMLKLAKASGPVVLLLDSKRRRPPTQCRHGWLKRRKSAIHCYRMFARSSAIEAVLADPENEISFIAPTCMYRDGLHEEYEILQKNIAPLLLPVLNSGPQIWMLVELLESRRKVLNQYAARETGRKPDGQEFDE
jgi:hypothetical protein